MIIKSTLAFLIVLLTVMWIFTPIFAAYSAWQVCLGMGLLILAFDCL